MTAARAFLGMSHSPLLGINHLDAPAQDELDDALDRTRELVRRWRPDLVVLVAPDHYNGFFNDVMPPFCIGTEARGVGDFRSPSGPLTVAAGEARGLARHLLDDRFDPALSQRMVVDHGFTQVLGWLWGSLAATPPVLPVFLNAASPASAPRVARCAQLGASIGRYLDEVDGRVLVLGSGGLSHESPLLRRSLDGLDPAGAERLLERRTASSDELEARLTYALAAADALEAGEDGMKPLNPDWDQRWMDIVESGRLDDVAVVSDADISADAGLSAHESKTWVVARAATTAGPRLATRLRYYRASPPLLVGFGILLMTAVDDQA